MSLHGNNEPPRMESSSLLRPGSLTLARLTEREHTRQPKPYCDCDLPNCKEGQRPCCNPSPGAKRQGSCAFDCELSGLAESCGCQVLDCPASVLDPCLQDKSKVKRQEQSSRDCKRSCNDPCAETTILADLSTTSLTLTKSSRTPRKMPTCFRNLTDDADEFHSCVNRLSYWLVSQPDEAVMVTAYFDKFSVDRVVDVPAADLDTLTGTLGGNLGLFVGMSAMSLTEHIEFFVISVLMLTCGCCGSRNSQVLHARSD